MPQYGTMMEIGTYSYVDICATFGRDSYYYFFPSFHSDPVLESVSDPSGKKKNKVVFYPASTIHRTFVRFKKEKSYFNLN